MREAWLCWEGMTVTLAVMTLHGTPQPTCRLKLSGHHRDVITVYGNLRDDDGRMMEPR